MLYKLYVSPFFCFVAVVQGQGDESAETNFALSEYHGRNIKLLERKLGAKRVASYNQAVVISQKPLQKGHPYQVLIWVH